MSSTAYCFTMNRDRPEHNDCVVRAMATAAGISYAIAHATCRESGRKDHKRTSLAAAMEVLEVRVGCQSKYISTRDLYATAAGPRQRRQFYPTLAKVFPLMAKGKYIVSIGWHAFAVIDGVQYDNRQNGPRCRVRCIYEII